MGKPKPTQKDRAFDMADIHATYRVIPLTKEERMCFGWAEDQLIMSTISPSGLRSIPTRDVLQNGLVIYGSIETLEPPPGVTAAEWQAVIGDEDDPHVGLVS